MGPYSFLAPVAAGLAPILLAPRPAVTRAVLCQIDSRKWRLWALGAAGLLVFAMIAGFGCAGPFESVRMCLGEPYRNPPPSLGDSDLVGTWEAHYGRSVDRLTLRPDRTFKQAYASGYQEGYLYETGWNGWGVQRLRDGRVRVHLQGARFYPEGIALAEEGGWGHGVGSFYDPISLGRVDMSGKLILNVRVDPDGELILYHMWSTGDQGFALTGCERDVFRRVASP